MPDGRQEILERFATAAGQLVTNGLNQDGFTDAQRAKIAAALESGSRFVMTVELDPVRVLVDLRRGNRAVRVFAIE